MTTSFQSSKLKPQVERNYAHKRRNCLMCRGAFVSEWPGERVCQDCEKSGEWRDGASLPDANRRT